MSGQPLPPPTDFSESAHVQCLVQPTIDKKFSKNYSFSNDGQIMRRSIQYLKMIRGILYREVNDDDNTLQ